MQIGADIERDGFAFRTSEAIRCLLPEDALNGWHGFASSWNDLRLDLYMADGGRYRRRRFAVFSISTQSVTRKPHQPHYQSPEHNPLNGGVERWFEPICDIVVNNPFMPGILGICRTIFDAISPHGDQQTPWHVEVHQFRIEAAAGELGHPTPEGIHRDGVDWACVLLINRRNVLNGVTHLFDQNGSPIGHFTLTDRLDAVFLDDSRVLHGVTPILPLNARSRALRDVLVVTFRRDRPI